MLTPLPSPELDPLEMPLLPIGPDLELPIELGERARLHTVRQVDLVGGHGRPGCRAFVPHSETISAASWGYQARASIRRAYQRRSAPKSRRARPARKPSRRAADRSSPDRDGRSNRHWRHRHRPTSVRSPSWWSELGAENTPPAPMTSPLLTSCCCCVWLCCSAFCGWLLDPSPEAGPAAGATGGGTTTAGAAAIAVAIGREAWGRKAGMDSPISHRRQLRMRGCRTAVSSDSDEGRGA